MMKPRLAFAFASDTKGENQSCRRKLIWRFSHIWLVREGYYHPNRAFCDARHSGSGQL